MPIKYSVIPAQAGIHGAASRITDKWIPDQVRDDSIYFSAMSAHPSPPSSPPCAGIQGHKETAGLLPRIPGQAGHDGERGNALFLILIAVALFAALSYAVTQSSRGGAGIDREQEKLDTAVAQQCQASVDQGIMRLKIIGDCPEGRISYELADGMNENPDNPDDTSCFLFHNDGAGVTPCGEYLEPNFPLGMISGGDTETYAAVPGIGYIYCPTWNSVLCTPHISFDGAHFAARAICFNTADNAQITLGNTLCAAACGGTVAGVLGNATTSDTQYRYMPDGSLNADISGCTNALNGFGCSCF